MAVLRTAYVKVKPDTDGFDSELKRRLRRIDAGSHGKDAGRSFGDGLAKGFNERGGAFAKVVATSAARLTLLGSAAAAAAPGVVHLTAALAPAAGALVALPAALGAVKVASGTFKLAVAGVGDAISTGLTGSSKEAQKALEGLPPAARDFSKSIIELKPQLTGLRSEVSQGFFTPLTGEISSLAAQYLPMVSKQLTSVAGQLGGLGGALAQAARKAQTFNAVKALLAGTSAALGRLKRAVGPITTAFSALISATAPLLPRIAKGFADIAIKASNYVAQASKSGKVAGLFKNAVVTLKDLGAIAGNVGSILGTVFAAATADGTNLLSNLKNLTGQAAAFLKSGDGGSALAGIFSTLGQLGESLRTALAAVLPSIAQSVTVLVPALGGLAPVFAQLVVAAAPLLPYFTQLAATALTALIPAVAALSGWLVQNQDVLKGLVISLGAVYAIMKVVQVGTVAWSAVTTVATGVQRAWNSNFVLRLRVWALDAAAMIRSAAVTVAHTVATTASRAANALWNSTFVTRLGVWAIDAAAMVRSTAATVAHTIATTASRAATAVSTAAVTAFVAVKNFEYVAWIRSAAATIASTTATIASSIAQRAAAVASKIWAAGQWLVNAALSANPIGLVVVAIGALVAAVVIAYQKNETFRKIVQAVWAGIKTAIGATVSWFTGTVWPSLQRAFGQLQGVFQALGTVASVVWKGISAAIQFHWGIVKGVFNLLSTAITKTIPDAFKSGVAGIRSAWDKVKDAAKTPVSFVVNSVLNPLIGGYNKLAGLFGVPKAPTIPGFATGGRIPGAASSVDNRLATLTDPLGRALGPLKVATGEFIVNARDTARALPLLQWINSGMRGGPDTASRYIGRRPVREPGDGSEGWAFAKGGLVGFLSDVWGAVSDPAKAIKAPVEAAISQIPGSGGFRDLAVGLSHKLLGGFMGFVTGTSGGAGGNVGAAQAFVRSQAGKPYVWASAGPGGYDCSGIVSAAYNVLRGQSPYSHTFSTGSMPGPWFDTGRKMGPLVAGWSHPGQAPASASVGHMAGMIGGMPFESTGSSGVRVGGSARRVTDFANIGAARFARGGLVPFGSYDSGGYLPTGLSLAHNGTGRPEPVGHRLGGDVHLHFHGPVASKQAAEDMVVAGYLDARKKKRLP